MADETQAGAAPSIDADSAFSTVVTSTATSTSNVNKNSTSVDYGEDTYGAKFILGGDSAIDSVYTSDFGAIQAAKDIALRGTEAAAEAATATAVRFLYPNGSILVANAYWSLLEVPTIQDRTLRGRIDLTFTALPTRYVS